MRWITFMSTAAVIALIILYEWSRMKKKPIQDKLAFFTLLLFGWALSLFDLADLPGPTEWLEILFRPFGQYMDK